MTSTTSRLPLILPVLLSLPGGPVAPGLDATPGGPAKASQAVTANQPATARQSTVRSIRIAVLAEPGFPTIDIDPIGRGDLERVLTGLPVSFLNAEEVATALIRERFDLVVLPSGSAFPKAAWPSLHAFLQAGGGWVNVGGTPVSVPIVRDSQGWRAEPRATSYHRALSIVHTFAVDTSRVTRLESLMSGLTAADAGRLLRVDRAVGLNVRFAETRDYPGEDGTGGQRDARLDPLVRGLRADGTAVSAPIVAIDRLLGPFAGGRWVLANVVGRVDPALVRALVESASSGATSFEIRPTHAGFLPGERLSFQVRLFRPWRGLDAAAAPECQVEIEDERQNAVARFGIALAGRGELLTGSGAAPTSSSAALARGLYRVTARVPRHWETGSGATRSITAGTGFWVYDPVMLAGGTPLAAGRGWLERASQPFPVTGTTYMASDVHRKFLLEPDAARWDRDFAAMRRAGVNTVRTGVWTAWKNLMLDVGAPNEAALRALDVFVLTARRYDIPVVFTVFAFLPESWGGANPYLDPRALQAQRALLGTLARRYRAAHDVVWDLINEPSFSSAAQLWSTRPNYDAFENTAWRAWLAARFGTTTPSMLDAAVTAAWGTLPGEGAALPPLDEFRDRHLWGALRPLRARDYKLFAQEMFTRWVTEMTGAIREAGGVRQLVTVGQDEGGIAERPAPLFHGGALDFTSIHNWWLNDTLLWDVVMTRRPESPAPGGRDRPDDVQSGCVASRGATTSSPATCWNGSSPPRWPEARRDSCSRSGTPTSTCQSTTRRALVSCGRTARPSRSSRRLSSGPACCAPTPPVSGSRLPKRRWC